MNDPLYLQILYNSSTATVAWGNITGTITNQTDLITYINSQSNFNQVLVKTNGVGSPYSIPTSENNSTYTNQGAAAEVYLNLPAATVGLTYSAFNDDSDNMRFVANGTDVIRVGGEVSSAGGYTQLQDVGSAITLRCTKSGQWSAMSAMGTINLG